MIIKLPESEANFLGLEIRDKVSEKEQQEWMLMMENILSSYETLNVLVVLDADVSWGLDAGLEDIKWVLRHMNSLDRIAIVSSRTAWKWLVSIDSFFASMVGIEEKHFETGNEAEAWAWLKSGS